MGKPTVGWIKERGSDTRDTRDALLEWYQHLNSLSVSGAVFDLYTSESTAPMSTAKRTKIKAEVIQKERDCLLMRQQGFTFEEIAHKLAYKGESGAREAFRRALVRTLQEPASEVRELELSRLDALMTVAWDKAMSGDLKAIDRVLKIQDRRARYLGIDAPQQTQIEVTRYDGNIIDSQVQRLLEFVRSERQGELDRPTSSPGTDS